MVRAGWTEAGDRRRGGAGAAGALAIMTFLVLPGEAAAAVYQVPGTGDTTIQVELPALGSLAATVTVPSGEVSVRLYDPGGELVASQSALAPATASISWSPAAPGVWELVLDVASGNTPSDTVLSCWPDCVVS